MDLKSGRSLSAAMIAGSSSVGADTQLDLHQGKPFQFQIFPYFSLLEAAAAVKFKLCTFFWIQTITLAAERSALLSAIS
jgi:hypothetical protein